MISFSRTHQLAVKKLQIWRLPPILIVHLKRFQCVNNKWIKSHKIVDFPFSGLDLTKYLAAVPAETLIRWNLMLIFKCNRYMITQREQLALKIQNLAGQIKTSNNNILCVGSKCNKFYFHFLKNNPFLWIFLGS